jgi:hypothetical protein
VAWRSPLHVAESSATSAGPGVPVAVRGGLAPLPLTAATATSIGTPSARPSSTAVRSPPPTSRTTWPCTRRRKALGAGASAHGRDQDQLTARAPLDSARAMPSGDAGGSTVASIQQRLSATEA